MRIWWPVGSWLEPFHLQLGHFPQYLALFPLGVVAYRRNWLAGLTRSQAKAWSFVAVAAVALFPVLLVGGGALANGDLDPFKGGLHWQSLAYCLWEQFLGAALIVSLLVWFRDRLNHQGPLARAMSNASYATYVFHPVVLVAIGIALSGSRLDLALTFLLVAPVAVSLSFLTAIYIRRLPLARDVL